MKPVSRRSFNHGLALTGLTLPFLRLLGIDPFSSRLAEASPPVPRRFVFYYVPDGIVSWDTDLGTIGSSPTDFTLGAMISTPFAKLKQDLVLLHGLDMVTEKVADTHEAGMVLNLTASSFQAACGTTKDCVGGGNVYGVANASLDQYIQQKAGRQTAFGAIQLAAQTNNGLTLSFKGPGIGTDVQPNGDPINSFNTLFAQVRSGGPDPQLALQNRLRKSVLDNVTSDLTALRTRLGTADRQRLDAHLSSIQDVEEQLKAPATACTKPSSPSTPSGGLNAAGNYPWILQSHLSVLAAALACDLTRCAVVQCRACYSELSLPFDIPSPGGVGPSLSFGSDNIHNMSHACFSGGPGYTNFVALKQWHFQQIATFALQLKNTMEPTGSGESMLDNTLIVINSDVSEGHTHARMPLMTLGGKNLGVQVGQFLRFPSGTPHANLLVSVLNALGLSDTSFGGVSTGALSGFLRP